MQNLRQAFINLIDSNNNTISLTPLYKEFLTSQLDIEMIEILREFNKSNDTHLTAFPTTCGSDTCSYFEEAIFFTLVGNNSNNYCLLALVSKKDREVMIRFCENIIPSSGIELNTLITPENKRFGNMPF